MLRLIHPKSVAISFELVPGQPTNVAWNFNVGAVATVENEDLTPGSGFAVATSFFSHTMTWGGITSVIDEATGLPVDDWTLESASGFDYSQAVPEPSTLVLAALCVLSLPAYLWQQRRRRYDSLGA
jgi:hypothetical protein